MKQVADFKSELAADIVSESVADLRRNQQSGMTINIRRLTAGVLRQ